MRPLDEQGQYSARLVPGGKADRFWRGDAGVALTDDFRPATDDRALNEAKAPEGNSADLADEFAGRAGTSASVDFVGGLLLRHLVIIMP